MKCTPVSTPRGSAFIAVLLFGRGMVLVAVDREVGAVHAAQVAAATLFWLNHVRRMVSLGIEGGRERQDLGGTELHAKAARLTALHNDVNSTFCHESPTCWSDWALQAS